MPQMQQTRQTPNAKRNSGYAYRAMTQTHRMLPTHNTLIFNKKAKTSCGCLSAGCFRYKTVSQRNTRSDYLRMISML